MTNTMNSLCPLNYRKINTHNPIDNTKNSLIRVPYANSYNNFYANLCTHSFAKTNTNTNTSTNTNANTNFYANTSPYGVSTNEPNSLLLTPAIFGTAAAFILGFLYFGHPITSGYSKYIFFVSIYGIIASIGAGYYIYELLLNRDHDGQLAHVVFPLMTIIFLFTSIFNLTYSLYPFTFSGTIGDTKITQFLSFLALSIGSISVGESFNVTAETTGVQVLAATESFWNLFSLSLLISLLV